MMLSPLRNLNEFIKKHPPQVICTLCIILLVMATFSFAFYMEHSKNLLNTDVEESWNSLKRHLNGLKACVKKSHTNNHYYKYEPNVSVLANVYLSNNSNSNFTHFYSVVPLKGWISQCHGPMPENIKVSFSIPNKSRQQKVCVMISGPEQFLPKYTEPSCAFEPSQNGNLGEIIYTDDHSPCTNDIIKIQYDTSRSKHFAVYLNEFDKSAIYVHLMWLSYILVFLVIVVICYAMFKKTPD